MRNLILLGFFSIIYFSSCQKDNTIYQTYFWTPKDSSNVKLDLYIDGQFEGSIPFLTEKPDCSNDSSIFGLIAIPLKIGTYDIKAKDKQGNIKYSSQVKIKKGGAVSAPGDIGELLLYGDYGCLYFGVTYQD